MMVCAIGAQLAEAQSREAAKVVARITRGEAPVTWHMSDGFVFQDVKVTKTEDSWAEIEYSRSAPPPRGVTVVGPIPGSPEPPRKIERRRCWVNVSQVSRIYNATRPEQKPETEQDGAGQAPTRPESK